MRSENVRKVRISNSKRGYGKDYGGQKGPNTTMHSVWSFDMESCPVLVSFYMQQKP